jgi:hypothetical protein
MARIDGRLLHAAHEAWIDILGNSSEEGGIHAGKALHEAEVHWQRRRLEVRHAMLD